MNYSYQYFGQDITYYNANRNNFTNSLRNILNYNLLSDAQKSNIYKTNNIRVPPKIFTDFNSLIGATPFRKNEIIDNIINSLSDHIQDMFLQFGELIILKDPVCALDFFIIKFRRGLTVYHGSKILHDVHAINNALHETIQREMIANQNFDPYLSKKSHLNSFYGGLDVAQTYGSITNRKFTNEYFNYDESIMRRLEDVPSTGFNSYDLVDDLYLFMIEFDFANMVDMSFLWNHRDIEHPTLITKYTLPATTNRKFSIYSKLFNDINSIMAIKVYNIQLLNYYINNTDAFTLNYDETTGRVDDVTKSSPEYREILFNYSQVFGLNDLYGTICYSEGWDDITLVHPDMISNYVLDVFNKVDYTNYKFNRIAPKPVNFINKASMQVFDYNVFKEVLLNMSFEPTDKRDQVTLDNRLKERARQVNIFNFLKQFVGNRFSYYETDGVVFNRIMYIIFHFLNRNVYNGARFEISGVYDPSIMYMGTLSSFHEEFIINPTNKLVRNYHNTHDEFQGVNKSQLLTEFRKYKTTNILALDAGGRVVGFHEGNLMEHSIWSGLYSIMIFQKLITDNIYLENDITTGGTPLGFGQDSLIGNNKNYLFTVILTALYHDLAKAGDCNYTRYEFKNRDPSVYEAQICRNRSNMFIYDVLGFHPEMGYFYLRDKPFKISDIDFNLNREINITTSLSEIFTLYNIPLNEVKTSKSINVNLNVDYYMFLKLAIACHWFFGDIILRNTVYSPRMGRYISDGVHMVTYINKLLYYFNINVSNFKTNTGEFEIVNYLTLFRYFAILTMIISSSDILGSKFPHAFKSLINLPGFKNDFIRNNPDVFRVLDTISSDVFLQLFRYTPVESVHDIPYEATILGKQYIELMKSSIENIENINAYIIQLINDVNTTRTINHNFNLIFNIEDYIRNIDTEVTVRPIDETDMKSVLFMDHYVFIQMFDPVRIVQLFTNIRTNILKVVFLLNTESGVDDVADLIENVKNNMNILYTLLDMDVKLVTYDKNLEETIDFEMDIVQTTNSCIYLTLDDTISNPLKLSLSNKYDFSYAHVETASDDDTIIRDIKKSILISHNNNYEKWFQKMMVINNVQLNLLNSNSRYLKYSLLSAKKDINATVLDDLVGSVKIQALIRDVVIDHFGFKFEVSEYVPILSKMLLFLNENLITNNIILTNNYMLKLIAICIYYYQELQKSNPVNAKDMVINMIDYILFGFIPRKSRSGRVAIQHMPFSIFLYENIIQKWIVILNVISSNSDPAVINGVNMNNALITIALRNFSYEMSVEFNNKLRDLINTKNINILPFIEMILRTEYYNI